MPTFLGLGSYILTQGLWASAYLQRDVCLTTYVIKVEALVRDLVTESTPGEQRKSKQGERMKMPRLETKDTIQKCLQHSRIQFWVILNYYKALKTTSLNEIIRGKIAHKNVLSE